MRFRGKVRPVWVLDSNSIFGVRYNYSFVKEFAGIIRSDKDSALFVVFFFLRDLQGAGRVLPVFSSSSTAPALPRRRQIVLLSCVLYEKIRNIRENSEVKVSEPSTRSVWAREVSFCGEQRTQGVLRGTGFDT